MNKFFNWIRRSQIVRSDSRWIGGVCAGIADRIGWDRSVVRVIMVVLGLFGAGLAAYAVAWLLLPDAHDEILFERIIHGDWPSEGIFAFIVFVIACVLTTFTFWGTLTVLGFFGLVYWSGEQAKNPKNWQTGQTSGSVPMQPGAASQPQYAQPGAMPQSNYAQGSASAQPFAANAYTAHPQSQAYAGPRPTLVYPRIVERERIINRRRGMGLVGNLVVLGLILLGIASVQPLGRYVLKIDSHDIVSWIRLGALGFVGLTIFLFALTLVLALMGRRSGGYGTFAGILASIIVLGIIPAGALFTYDAIGSTDLPTSKNVRMISQDHITLKTDKKLVRQLNEGMTIRSNSIFHTREVTLDLTNWEEVEGTHKWTDKNGKTRESGCPTGKFAVALDAVKLNIKIPAGCTYTHTYGGLFAVDRDFTTTTNSEGNLYIGSSAENNVSTKINTIYKKRAAQMIKDYIDTHSGIDTDDLNELNSAHRDATSKYMDFADWADTWVDDDDADDIVGKAVGDLADDYRKEISERLKNSELHLITTGVASFHIEEVKK